MKRFEIAEKFYSSKALLKMTGRRRVFLPTSPSLDPTLTTTTRPRCRPSLQDDQKWKARPGPRAN